MNSGAVPIPLPVRSIGESAAQFRFPSRFARFGGFELDVQRQELYRSGIRIRLQSKVYEALLVLLEAPHQIVSREVIRQRLWPGDSLVNFDANVNTTVNKLRQVLGDSPDAQLFVETIPRKGYSFIAAFTCSMVRAATTCALREPSWMISVTRSGCAESSLRFSWMGLR